MGKTLTLEELVAIEGYADEHGDVTDEMLTKLIDFANSHLASRPAEQPRGEPVAWRSPDELPDVKANDCQFFQIAVRRKSGKVFSYPAVYCNSLALTVEYDPKESSGNRWSSHFLSEDLADEGELGFTGWWDVKSNSEYDTCYEPALQDDDELVAWCELPSWNPETAQTKHEQAVGDGDNESLVAIVDRARDVLGEAYAKYQRQIGPFASQLQKSNGALRRVRDALATPRPAVTTPAEVTDEVIQAAAIDCARSAYGYWRGDSTGGASAIEYFDRNMDLPGNQHCIEMFADTIRKHLTAQCQVHKDRQVMDETRLVAEEGLDYFEKAGDAGDKLYVQAIRAALIAQCQVRKGGQGVDDAATMTPQMIGDIVGDLCDMEPFDPEHQDAVCVNVNDLIDVLNRYATGDRTPTDDVPWLKVIVRQNAAKAWDVLRQTPWAKENLTALVSPSAGAVVPEDTAILDFLCTQHVEVRAPAMYGSHATFLAVPKRDSEGVDDDVPSDLREKARKAMLESKWGES